MRQSRMNSLYWLRDSEGRDRGYLFPEEISPLYGNKEERIGSSKKYAYYPQILCEGFALENLFSGVFRRTSNLGAAIQNLRRLQEKLSLGVNEICLYREHSLGATGTGVTDDSPDSLLPELTSLLMGKD